jgi:ubiquinol-cytochrome c reductase cytochrome c subunit
MGDSQPLPERPRGRTHAVAPRRPRLLVAALVAIAAVSLVAAAVVQAVPGGGGSAPAVLGADAQAGSSIYASNCAPCHGPQGKGGIGPTLAAAAFPSLVSTKVRVGGGGMPAFGGKLAPADIDNVALYVAQKLADPAAGKASVTGGGGVYRLYCAGCHGGSARGGALVQGKNAPSLKNRPAANALAAMVRGPRNMPVFTGTLDVTQQASVARYIQAALQNPAHPGGWGLGFIGPVVEGIVSWLALVVLIFIAVWLAWQRGGAHRDRA